MIRPVKFSLKYGVWILLAAVVLVWELLGVKSFRKAFKLGPRDHPSISELVWSFERRFGHVGQAAVLVAMTDLTAHFLFGTSLLPLLPAVGAFSFNAHVRQGRG